MDQFHQLIYQCTHRQTLFFLKTSSQRTLLCLGYHPWTVNFCLDSLSSGLLLGVLSYFGGTQPLIDSWGEKKQHKGLHLALVSYCFNQDRFPSSPGLQLSPRHPVPNYREDSCHHAAVFQLHIPYTVSSFYCYIYSLALVVTVSIERVHGK